MVDIDGDTIVVGSSNNDISGSIFVFVRSGTIWTEQQKIKAADAADSDAFGASVSIDGETVVVGAYLDDDSFGGAGSAYVFTRSGTSWTQQQKLVASDPGEEDQFGNAVSISGETIAVGASGDDDDTWWDTGSVYVFTRSVTTWAQQQKLVATDATKFPYDAFGQKRGVAISGDVLIVGAHGNDGVNKSAGAAYVFIRSGSTWVQNTILTPGDKSWIGHFGWSAAFDGNVVIIGASRGEGATPYSGTAFIFGPAS